MKPPTGFFHLPTELRHEIYGYLQYCHIRDQNLLHLGAISPSPALEALSALCESTPRFATDFYSYNSTAARTHRDLRCKFSPSQYHILPVVPWHPPSSLHLRNLRDFELEIKFSTTFSGSWENCAEIMGWLGTIRGNLARFVGCLDVVAVLAQGADSSVYGVWEGRNWSRLKAGSWSRFDVAEWFGGLLVDRNDDDDDLDDEDLDDQDLDNEGRRHRRNDHHLIPIVKYVSQPLIDALGRDDDGNGEEEGDHRHHHQLVNAKDQNCLRRLVPGDNVYIDLEIKTMVYTSTSTSTSTR